MASLIGGKETVVDGPGCTMDGRRWWGDRESDEMGMGKRKELFGVLRLGDLPTCWVEGSYAEAPNPFQDLEGGT